MKYKDEILEEYVFEMVNNIFLLRLVSCIHYVIILPILSDNEDTNNNYFEKRKFHPWINIFD